MNIGYELPKHQRLPMFYWWTP